MNLLLVAEASDFESVVESQLKAFDEEGDFFLLFHHEGYFFPLFLSVSSDPVEDVLCLLFLDFLICSSTFLFAEGFTFFA